MARTLTSLILLTAASVATGAEFCATNSAELQAALDAAETNFQDDHIKIRTGNYSAPPGGFVFDNAFADNNDLHISGGWSAFFGNPCGIRLTSDPFATALNGNGTDRVLAITGNTNTDVVVEQLRFLGGNTIGLTPACGAGLNVFNYVGWEGDVEIVRNAFTNNVSGSFGGGFCGGSGGRLDLLNNLFFANSAECTNGAASLTQNGPDGVYIVSNTVAFNTIGPNCTATGGGGLRYGGDSESLFINNIFWGNENFDLILDNSVSRLVANNYLNLEGTPGAGSGVNYDFDPMFLLTNFFDLRLAPDSPLIELGVTPAGTASWQLTDVDLDGNPRIRGAAVDIGAYEADDLIFEDDFSGN